MFCASYVYLFNLRWTGFTSPQPIVGRVYPSTLALYPSKGRVDGSLDEAVVETNYCEDMIGIGEVRKKDECFYHSANWKPASAIIPRQGFLVNKIWKGLNNTSHPDEETDNFYKKNYVNNNNPRKDKPPHDTEG